MTFRVAHDSDIERAAETLACAFADYAWINWTVAPDDRHARIRRVQEMCLREVALPHGVVIVNDEVTAVIALTAPESMEKIDGAVWSEVAEASGDSPAAGFDLHLPPAPTRGSWELATVGVHPSAQGQGLGTGIIEAALDYLDRDHGATVPVHLETSDLRNVALYERCGFAVHAVTSEDPAPTVWSMQRA